MQEKEGSMIFIDCKPDEVKQVINGKDIFLYGAGRASGKVVKFCKDEEIYIKAIVDKFPNKYMNSIDYNRNDYRIIGVSELLGELKITTKESVIFITSVIYEAQILEELNSIAELDNVAYISFKSLSNKRVVCDFEFTKGVQKIPKKIHYCWFGKGKLGKEMQRCIDSWKRYAPDFEIIRWDENNYDVSKIPYIKEAYENKQWAFVSDYARLDILEQQGGIYYDVDVELVKNPEVLLCDEAFFGMHGNFIINTGVGYGSVAHNIILKEMMDVYNDVHFINKNGEMNRTANNVWNMMIFEKYGFKARNRYQNIKGIVVYPSEVLSPIGPFGTADFFSDKTISIHHGTKTWLTNNEKKQIKK